jgi:hypothetical protein
LAHNGIINNYPEIGNIRYDSDQSQINFINYEHAVLSNDHTDSFEIDSTNIINTLNDVYEKPNTEISADFYHIFNCYTMYDVIRAMISLQSNNKKIIQIIQDANNIMQQIYVNTKEFKYKSHLHSAIDWLYQKHFGTIEYKNIFKLYKTNDMEKLEFLAEYVYQFDFNNNM